MSHQNLMRDSDANHRNLDRRHDRFLASDTTKDSGMESHEDYKSLSSPLAHTCRPPPLKSSTIKGISHRDDDRESEYGAQVDTIIALMLISTLVGVASSTSTVASRPSLSLLAAGAKALCAAAGVAVAIRGGGKRRQSSQDTDESDLNDPLIADHKETDNNNPSANASKTVSDAVATVSTERTHRDEAADALRELLTKPEVQLVLDIIGSPGDDQAAPSPTEEASSATQECKMGTELNNDASTLPFPSLQVPQRYIDSVVDNIALTEERLVQARTQSIRHSLVAKAALQGLREEHERRQQEREAAAQNGGAVTPSSPNDHPIGTSNRAAVLPYFSQTSLTRLNSDEMSGTKPGSFQSNSSPNNLRTNSLVGPLARRSRSHGRRDSVGSMMLAVCHSSSAALYGQRPGGTPTPPQSTLQLPFAPLGLHSWHHQQQTPSSLADFGSTFRDQSILGPNSSQSPIRSNVGHPLQPPLAGSPSGSSNIETAGEHTLPAGALIDSTALDTVQPSHVTPTTAGSQQRPRGGSFLTSPSAVSLYSSAPLPPVPLDLGGNWKQKNNGETAPATSAKDEGQNPNRSAARSWSAPTKDDRNEETDKTASHRLFHASISPHSGGSSANTGKGSRAMSSGRWPLPATLPTANAFAGSKAPSAETSSLGQFSAQTPMGHFLPVVGSISATLPLTPPHAAAHWPNTTLHPHYPIPTAVGSHQVGRPSSAGGNNHFSPLHGENDLFVRPSSSGRPTPPSEGGIGIITGGILGSHSQGGPSVEGGSSRSLISPSATPAKHNILLPRGVVSDSASLSSATPRPSFSLTSPVVPQRSFAFATGMGMPIEGAGTNKPVVGAADVSPSASASESTSLATAANKPLIGIATVVTPSSPSPKSSTEDRSPQTKLSLLPMSSQSNESGIPIRVPSSTTVRPPTAVVPVSLLDAMANSPSTFHSQTGSAFRSFDGEGPGSEGGPLFLASGSTAVPCSPLVDRPLVISSSASSSSHNMINVIRLNRGRGGSAGEREEESSREGHRGTGGILPIIVPPTLTSLDGRFDFKGSINGTKSDTGTLTESMGRDPADISVATTAKNAENSSYNPNLNSSTIAGSCSVSMMEHAPPSRKGSRRKTVKEPTVMADAFGGPIDHNHAPPLPFLSFVPTSHLNSDEVGSPIDHSEEEGSAQPSDRYCRRNTNEVIEVDKKTQSYNSGAVPHADAAASSGTAVIPFLSFRPYAGSAADGTGSDALRNDHSGSEAYLSGMGHPFLKKGPKSQVDSCDEYSAHGSIGQNNLHLNGGSNLSPFSVTAYEDDANGFDLSRMLVHRLGAPLTLATVGPRPMSVDGLKEGLVESGAVSEGAVEDNEDDEDEVDDSKRLSFSDEDDVFADCGSRPFFESIKSRPRSASASPCLTIPSVTVVESPKAGAGRRRSTLQIGSTSSICGSFCSNVNYIVSHTNYKTAKKSMGKPIRALASSNSKGAAEGSCTSNEEPMGGQGGFRANPTPYSVFSHLGSAAASLTSPHHPYHFSFSHHTANNTSGSMTHPTSHNIAANSDSTATTAIEGGDTFPEGSPLVHRFRSVAAVTSTSKPTAVSSGATPTSGTVASASSAEGLGLAPCVAQSSDNLNNTNYGSNSNANFSMYDHENGTSGFKLSNLAGRMATDSRNGAGGVSMYATTSSLDIAAAINASSPKAVGLRSAEQSHMYPMPTFVDVAEVEAMLRHRTPPRDGAEDRCAGDIEGGVHPTTSTVSLFLDSGAHRMGRAPVLLSSSASYSQTFDQGLRRQLQERAGGHPTHHQTPSHPLVTAVLGHPPEGSDAGIHSPLEILSITSGLRPSFGCNASNAQHLLFLQSTSGGGDPTQSSDHVLSILAPSVASSLARPLTVGSGRVGSGASGGTGGTNSSGSSGNRFLASGGSTGNGGGFGLGYVSGGGAAVSSGAMSAAIFLSNLSARTAGSSVGSSFNNRALPADLLAPLPNNISSASIKFSSPETLQSIKEISPAALLPTTTATAAAATGDKSPVNKTLTASVERTTDSAKGAAELNQPQPPPYAPYTKTLLPGTASEIINSKVVNEGNAMDLRSPRSNSGGPLPKTVTIDIRSTPTGANYKRGSIVPAAWAASPTPPTTSPKDDQMPTKQRQATPTSESQETNFNRYRYSNRASGVGLLPSFASPHDPVARQARSFVYLHRKRRKLFERRSQLLWQKEQAQAKGTNITTTSTLQPPQSALPTTVAEGPLPKSFVDGKGKTWLISSHCLGTGGFGKVMVGVDLNTRIPSPSAGEGAESRATSPPSIAAAVKAVWLAGRSERDMFSLARELEVLAYVERMRVGVEGVLELLEAKDEKQNDQSPLSDDEKQHPTTTTSANNNIPLMTNLSAPSLRLVAYGFRFLVGHHSTALSPDGHLLITMNLLQGGSLSSILKKFGAIGVEAVRRHIREILYAIRTLHAIGLMHRDVKPANMLLKTKGDYGFEWSVEAAEGNSSSDQPQAYCCLADLGTVVFGERPDLRRHLTASIPTMQTQDHHHPHGTSLANQPPQIPAAALEGTIPYMAPEACIGNPTYASDIWSVGISCVELLTGTIPWPPLELSYPKMILARHGRDPAIVPTWRDILPSSMRPPVSADEKLFSSGDAREALKTSENTNTTDNDPTRHIFSFLEACLQPDPKDRPSAHDLIQHPFLSL